MKRPELIDLVGAGLLGIGAGILIVRRLNRILTAGVIPVGIEATPVPGQTATYDVTVTANQEPSAPPPPSPYVTLQGWSGSPPTLAPAAKKKLKWKGKERVRLVWNETAREWRGTSRLKLTGVAAGELVVITAASQNKYGEELLADDCEVLIVP
jgi:hypothetical protein